MTKTIAHSLGYSNYNCEAAIINYYHMDSTLSGHTDHSEQNLEAPLFSFRYIELLTVLANDSLFICDNCIKINLLCANTDL